MAPISGDQRHVGVPNAVGIARTRNNLRALADQLEAAIREIGRLTYLAAVDESITHLRATLERGTERSGDIVMDGDHGCKR